MTQVLIRLPWPPTRTSPNASGQGKWRDKAKAARSYKDECIQECWAQRVRKIDAQAVRVVLTFYPPTARAYDLDNVLARCKQGLDAVSEAIGVDDAHWQEVTLKRGDKVKGGCVLVHIKPLVATDTVPILGSIR